LDVIVICAFPKQKALSARKEMVFSIQPLHRSGNPASNQDLQLNHRLLPMGVGVILCHLLIRAASHSLHLMIAEPSLIGPIQASLIANCIMLPLVSVHHLSEQ
jgi:hypothetical protein